MYYKAINGFINWEHRTTYVARVVTGSFQSSSHNHLQRIHSHLIEYRSTNKCSQLYVIIVTSTVFISFSLFIYIQLRMLIIPLVLWGYQCASHLSVLYVRTSFSCSQFQRIASRQKSGILSWIFSYLPSAVTSKDPLFPTGLSMHLAPSWQTPHFRHSVIQKRNGITPCICMITTNATISCKILVKIGPVVSAENSLIEIALRVHVVVCRISSNISGYTGPIFTIFHHMKVLYVQMMDLYLTFQFVKGRCHGNQIMLP